MLHIFYIYTDKKTYIELFGFEDEESKEMFLIIRSVSGPRLEKILYTAMEDFAIHIVLGEGQSARRIKISLPKFTLLGTTTRLGLISTPLKDRFNIPLSFQFYQMEDI